MKQEDKEPLNTFDKELLLKDLCARLSYGVIVNVKGFDYDYNDKLTQIYKGVGCSIQVTTNVPYGIEEVKPYLFPISSMTEEQMLDFATVQAENCKGSYPTLSECSAIIDWGYKHHFDVNNLIEKRLAIDATGKNIY